MSDILDHIREKLSKRQPDLLPIIEPMLAETRMEYAGNTVYIHRQRMFERSGGSLVVAQRYQVTRRTAQRWLKRT